MITLPTRFLARRGTTASWNSSSTILAPGEVGIDSDTGDARVGNGTATWNGLVSIGYGYIDHGNQSGAVTYQSAAPTHALTLTGNTTITLANPTNGRTVAIFATGTDTYTLTVEGTAVPSGECVAVRVRGAWKVRVIGDATAPTAGTLSSSSITSSGFTLTATGAADETALHATPYSFSTDNGSTWSSWQSSASYAATGLSASTTYTCKHRVRDANGNTTVGTSINVTTSAALTWSTLFADTFAGSAGVINARAVTSGTGTWAKLNTNDIAIDGAGIAKWDTHGQSAEAIVDTVDQARIRWTVVYDLSSHTTGGSGAVVGVGVGTNSATTNQLYVTITCSTSGNNATVSLVDNAAGIWSIAAASGQALTGQPAAGTMVVDIDGTNKTGTVSINGTVIGNITGDTAVTLYTAYLRLTNSTAKADSVTYERYG